MELEKVNFEDTLIRLKDYTDASPNAILITNLNAAIVYVNKPWEKLTGYKLKEVKGKDPKFLKSEKTPKGLFKKMWVQLKSGKPFTMEELVGKHKDGSEYLVHASIYPIFKGQELILYLQTQFDIGKHKSIDKRLKESEEKYRRLVQSAHDAILMADAETGVIIDANAQAEVLLGRPIKEIIGLHQSQIHPKKMRKKYKKTFNIHVQRGGVLSEPLYIEHSSGKVIPVEVSASVVEVGDTKIIQGIFRDITERKKLDDLKKEFLALAAHELKTPITTLKLISQAHIAKIKRYGFDSLSIDELELIDRELERLTQLINDILDDTRIERGKLFLKFELTNLNKLLSIVVKKMRLTSKKHKIILKKLPENYSTILDQQRIEQVLINLISNAIKYSPPGSEIEVGARVEKKVVLFWVQDQGIGIPKSQLSKIFDRFYQVQEKEARGFGLGLYISKQIIEQHKGKIWLESVVGNGSKFFFSLPLPKNGDRK